MDSATIIDWLISYLAPAGLSAATVGAVVWFAFQKLASNQIEKNFAAYTDKLERAREANSLIMKKEMEFLEKGSDVISNPSAAFKVLPLVFML